MSGCRSASNLLTERRESTELSGMVGLDLHHELTPAAPFFVCFRGSAVCFQKTITIRVRARTGDETCFKVKPNTRMEKVFNTYATRKGVSVQALRFIYLVRLNGDDTPASLELEDGDAIDCILEQSAGKPVILLYPAAPVDVTVALQLSPLWNFSALYPKPPSNKLAQPSDSEVRHFVDTSGT